MYINKNEYDLSGEKGSLSLIHKSETVQTIFDKEDFERIQQYHWRISCKRQKKYVCAGQSITRGGAGIVYLANLVMGFKPDGVNEVDHIDGNSLNNTKENLRIVRRIDNIHNITTLSPNNQTTGIRGVSLNKRSGLYCVDFRYNNRRWYVKPYKKLESAVYLRYLFEREFYQDARHSSCDGVIQSIISKLSPEEKVDIERYFQSKK